MVSFTYYYINGGFWSQCLYLFTGDAIYARACSINHCDGDVLLNLIHPQKHWLLSPTERNGHILESRFTTKTQGGKLLEYSYSFLSIPFFFYYYSAEESCKVNNTLLLPSCNLINTRNLNRMLNCTNLPISQDKTN